MAFLVSKVTMTTTSTISWFPPETTLPSEGSYVLILLQDEGQSYIVESRFTQGKWCDLTTSDRFHTNKEVAGWSYPNMVIHE